MKNKYSLRLEEEIYKDICKFGWWNFTKWVKFIYENITCPTKEVSLSDKISDTKDALSDKPTLQELQSIADNILSDKPQEYKKRASPFQQQKIRDIENKTKNWNYREDGEEYTRQQLLDAAWLSDFYFTN